MSESGHLIAALSTAIISVCVVPDYAHVIYALGLILGARVPDQVELAVA